MARIFQLPRQVPIDNGAVVPGAKATFYLTGTSTKTDTYSDSALTTPNANPVVADADGVFSVVYLNPEIVYKLTLTDSDDVLIYTEDPIQDELTQANLGKIFYPQLSPEEDGLTVVNYYKPYGDPLRFLTNASEGVTDMTTALQNAGDWNKTVRVTRGTYLVSNLNFSADVEIIMEKGAIIKHEANATDHCIESSASLYISGGTIDGNKDNQTGRYNLIAATGTDLVVDNVNLTNSVNAAVNTDGVSGRAKVTNCKFTGMAEHGGSVGEVSYCVYIQGATSVVDVSNNDFLGDVPSTNNVAPTGVFISGTSVSLRCCENYFDNIGQNQAGNQGGCVDLYADADETTVNDNVFIGSYYQPLKLQNANNLTCTGNIIQGYDGDGPVAMINWAYARSFGSALECCNIADNIINIDGDTTNYGITLIGDATYNNDQVCLDGNIIKGGVEGVRTSLTNGINISGGSISGSSNYAIKGESMGDAGPSINISGVSFADIGEIPIYFIASEGTDNMNLNITGCQFDATSGTPTHFILARGDSGGYAERVSIVGNQFKGTASTTDIDLQYIDSAIVASNIGDATNGDIAETSVTLMREYGNSWNPEPVSSDGDTGGSGSAGAGNQYVEIEVGGTVYKVLHDGTV